MRTPIANILSGLLGGLVVLVVGAILISTNVIDTGDSQTVVRQSPITQTTSDTSGGGQGRTVSDIYEREGRGVVFVSSTGVSDSSSPFGGSSSGTATGSGFVVDKQGTILTNAHVVEGADSVTVNFEEGGAEIPAEVKGVDASSDLAVLKVDPDKVKDLTPVPLGDSSKSEVGDPVVAIGNPFGYSRTVTTGIVSGLQREIQSPNGFSIPNVIQTDASINPGNSGGPLMDAQGRVIGINSQIATGGGQGSVGIGFAIPINTAKQLLPELRKGGEVAHAYLGIQMSDLTSELAKQLNVPVDQGAVIVETTNGGPAEKAGLKGADRTSDQGTPVGGDVLVEVDGKKITNADDVATAIADNKPGDTITVTYYRDGKQESTDVTLGKRPDSLNTQSEPQGQDDNGGLLPLP